MSDDELQDVDGDTPNLEALLDDDLIEEVDLEDDTILPVDDVVTDDDDDEEEEEEDVDEPYDDVDDF